MQRFDRPLWQQFWAIAKPYWFSQEKWRARGFLFLLLFFSLGSSIFLILETLQRGEIISSLAAKDSRRFVQAILLFLGIIVVSVPLLSFNSYLQALLSLYWRRWLTHRFLNRYFDNQTFYQISFHPDIDNPDQRIAEDIKTFTQQSLYFLVILIESVLQLIGFTGVLWSISKPLMVVLIIYAIAGTVLTMVVFGRVLIAINFNQLKKEANFRFGLVRIRENAEAIAFYRGQKQEYNQVEQRFLEALKNFNHLIRWRLNLTLFQNGFQYLTFILPSIILAPQIFSGELEIGAIVQSETAFGRIWMALSLVINQFEQLSALAAGVNRLETFAQALKTPTVLPPKGATTIDTVENCHLALQHLTLQTPNYQTTLVRDVSLAVPPGQGLLIVGASGVGKSSLLRALAGLWRSGTGTIIRPALPQMLFLPQRPYMILGSLRRQLLYPNTQAPLDDQQLLQILLQVNLANLEEKFGGLDAVEDWSQVLSVGEQQRLAFARLLLTQPRYAILDEATSALDLKNEELLYLKLQQTSITFISVGHRSTLLKYHQQVLELAGDQAWHLRPATGYRFNAE